MVQTPQLLILWFLNLTTDELRKIDIQAKNIFAEPTYGQHVENLENQKLSLAAWGGSDPFQSRNIPGDEKIQLANLGSVSANPLRFSQLLPLIREVSCHPRLPLGQPTSLRSRSGAHAVWTSARVCFRLRPPTSIKDCRRSSCCA